MAITYCTGCVYCLTEISLSRTYYLCTADIPRAITYRCNAHNDVPVVAPNWCPITLKRNTERYERIQKRRKEIDDSVEAQLNRFEKELGLWKK